MVHEFFNFFRWTFPRKGRLTALAVINTISLRWLNTKSPKNQSSPKVVDVMTVSSKVSVVSPSLFWGRRWASNSQIFSIKKSQTLVSYNILTKIVRSKKFARVNFMVFACIFIFRWSVYDQIHVTILISATYFVDWKIYRELTEDLKKT